LVVSIVLLALYTGAQTNTATATVENFVAALLATQILYKITTPATAGPDNPAAISNLCISALHATTLYLLWVHNLKLKILSTEDKVGADSSQLQTLNSS